MLEWQPEYLLKYNLSPLNTPSTNTLDARLGVGTESTPPLSRERISYNRRDQKTYFLPGYKRGGLPLHTTAL